MRITCNRDNLIEGINIVQKAVPSKSTLPVLEGILIEIDDEMKLTGNDNEFGVVYEVPCVIEEKGSLVVNSKTFGDIIRKLPDIYVSMETEDDDTMLHITSGRASYRIKIISPENYPPVAFIDTANEIELPSDLFVKMVRETSFAASLDDKRVILKGVYIEQKDDELNFVAIDGFRLAKKSAKLPVSRDFGIIVPTKILNELTKSIKADDNTIKFACNDKQIMFYTDTFRMVSKLYTGDYIDYRRMIPDNFKTTVTVDTKKLQSAMERASLVVIDERRYPILLSVKPGEDIVLSESGENGNVKENITAEVVGDEINIGFAESLFTDCLKVIEDEKVVISLTSALNPCVVRGAEDDSFLYLLMPIKTKTN